MLSTVTSDEVLEVVGGGNALGFGSPEKVFLDGIGVVAKGDLDGSFEAVNVAVVAGSLIRLVLLHQRNELLGSPALGLKVVIVRGRRASVHLIIVNIATHVQTSDLELTIKLIEEPPPRMCAQGTTARRPSSHSEGRE